MTATQTKVSALPSLEKLKMDERKRSLAADVEDLAPSRKKQLRDENGQQMRMDAEKEKEVENFQKDAILRQMKEYKRDKKHLEDLINDHEKKSKYYDQHLRTIDAWFSQLLDEVRVLAADALPTPPPSATPSTGEEMYKSSLLFTDDETFSVHLALRSDNIKAAIADVFGRLPQASPDVQSLQKSLSEALAKEKTVLSESQRILSENASLHERLEKASYRYMMAEKKLDRAKSQQVQKLERQAYMGGNGEASSPTVGKKGVKSEHAETNGELENGRVASAEAEAARHEALAAAEQRKVQMEDLESENSRLTNELSAARTRLVSLNDDDYAGTSLFKTIKSQHDDVVKRINDLEATNSQLREEVKKFQSERMAYRTQIDDDNRNQSMDIESQIARAEQDLVRIRNSRDELMAQLTIKTSAEDERVNSRQQAEELAQARAQRVQALESEVERLKLQLGESQPPDTTSLDGLDTEALQGKLRTLQSQYDLLSNELPSMESAWRKTQALASKKIAEMAAWEEEKARLNAEKSKADQKYFAAMKAKDSRDGELRILKSQNSRSSEIVTQMKEAESKSKEYIVSLERSIAEYKDNISKLEIEVRSTAQKHKDSSSASDGLKKQIEELKAMIKKRDEEKLSAEKGKNEAEVSLKQVQTRLEDSKKAYEALKKSKTELSSTSSDDWRKVAICPVCNSNIRNTVLKLCGHVFCQSCVKDLISNRSRKCPSCGKGFGSNDQMGIVLT
ncbi:BRE1-domain-containing protein [Polychaeton citri CBS 116435]|uniref:E3 ubiquitin protein ligase n=1 Tax=Polychaeton citri CBS 116435 TaxID=1314669 RepID=A0A9P4UKY3_9PEZI|nr:BRE1-domain-containing protein [Polychaeton citri CBS 116435]